MVLVLLERIYQVVIAAGSHLFPFRTEKLSPPAPMVLQCNAGDRGFGIQSPTDYAFVRYVVNEHWPYYAYDSLPSNPWLTNKLGKLYFRLANWRQPTTMLADCYQAYWQAGCRKTRFLDAINQVELARVDIEDQEGYESLLPKCDERSVVVIEGIWRDWTRWHEMERDVRCGTTFDLYYCGIIFYDIKRFKHNYQINF